LGVLSLTGEVQRDLKRARIVLLAAAGRSTRRSPRKLGSSRGLSAFGGIAMPIMPRGCKTSRGWQAPDLYEATDKRILKLLDKPPPEGFPLDRTPCWPDLAMLIQYVWRSCAATRLTSRSQVVVRATTDFTP